MACPQCKAAFTTEQAQRTALGYRKFRCQVCKRLYHERTGTPFNFLEYPTDIVLFVVVWRVRYKLSLRDLAEMFLTRGLLFPHELGQDPRGIKQRYYPMQEFGKVDSAARFCQAF